MRKLSEKHMHMLKQYRLCETQNISLHIVKVSRINDFK